MRRDRDLELLQRVTADVAGSAGEGDLEALHGALDDSGLLTLAVDAADLENPLVWLAGVVGAAARCNPSLGFVLAGHYAADRAVLHAGGDDLGPGWRTTGTTLAPSGPGGAPGVLVPGAFDPAHVLVVDVPALAAWWVRADVLQPVPEGGRTGLEAARLRTLSTAAGSDRDDLPPDAALAALGDWALLTAAAAGGVAAAASQAAHHYADERVQFGAPISSFAGLRALLSEMRLAVSTLDGLLAAACEEPGPDVALDALAAAGRAAVDVSLTAIQVHGGYGYIEEYPVAGLLRDALSLRARGSGRRAALAAAAAARPAPP